jgi:Zn-dependent peptidase ImmA (M78 family)
MSSEALMPRKVYVNGAAYKVKRKALDGAYGICRQDHARIDIDPAQSEHSARGTLLHEVMHAALHECGGTATHGLDEAAEERVISTLAPAILLALRANPLLVAYLTA